MSDTIILLETLAGIVFALFGHPWIATGLFTGAAIGAIVGYWGAEQ